jgi:predicted ester cyclase
VTTDTLGSEFDRDAVPIDPETAVAAYVATWNERNYRTIPRLVSDGFVMSDPAAPAEGIPGPKGKGRVHGRSGLRRFVSMITAAFPDFRVAVRDVVADADAATAVDEVRSTMPHDGPLGGLPPTGRRVDLRCGPILRFEAGSIAERRFDATTIEANDQLGVTFPRVTGLRPSLFVRKRRTSRSRRERPARPHPRSGPGTAPGREPRELSARNVERRMGRDGTGPDWTGRDGTGLDGEGQTRPEPGTPAASFGRVAVRFGFR